MLHIKICTICTTLWQPKTRVVYNLDQAWNRAQPNHDSQETSVPREIHGQLSQRTKHQLRVFHGPFSFKFRGAVHSCEQDARNLIKLRITTQRVWAIIAQAQVLRLPALSNDRHWQHVQSSLKRLGHAIDVRIRLHGGADAQASLIYAVSINVPTPLRLHADGPCAHAPDDVHAPLLRACLYQPPLRSPTYVCAACSSNFWKSILKGFWEAKGMSQQNSNIRKPTQVECSESPWNWWIGCQLKDNTWWSQRSNPQRVNKIAFRL